MIKEKIKKKKQVDRVSAGEGWEGGGVGNEDVREIDDSRSGTKEVVEMDQQKAGSPQNLRWELCTFSPRRNGRVAAAATS